MEKLRSKASVYTNSMHVPTPSVYAVNGETFTGGDVIKAKFDYAKQISSTSSPTEDKARMDKYYQTMMFLLSVLDMTATVIDPVQNFSAENMPSNPDQLIKNGWRDITPESMRNNTVYREYLDTKTGTTVRFDPATPGATGFEGVDHYHFYNPASTGKADQYLNISGNPVPRGSKASHILPK